MKLVIGALAGAMLVIGAASAAPQAAASTAVVIKPSGRVKVVAGHPYYYRGVHYRYRYGGRYYNHRVWSCHRNARGVKVCRHRYS